MVEIAELLETLKRENPTALRGLAIVAAAGTIEAQTFGEVWAAVDGDGANGGGERAFEMVAQSRLVERTLDGQWRVRLPFRRRIAACLEQNGNGDLAKAHRLLAARLQQDGRPPATDSVAGRLAFARWLRHHLLSTDDGAQAVTTAFERAFDAGWTGDGRAIVELAARARPELAARDAGFIAMQGVQRYNEGDHQAAMALFKKLPRAADCPRTRLAAIALHLRGKLEGEKGRREAALADLGASLEIGREIGERHHQAQVLCTRAGLELEGLRKLSVKEDVEVRAERVVDELMYTLTLDRRPESRSVVYHYLAQALELAGEAALAAAALRFKRRVDRARGPAGQQYLEKTERELRRLARSVSEAQMARAEKALGDWLESVSSAGDDSALEAEGGWSDFGSVV